MLKALFSSQNLLDRDSEYYSHVHDIIESEPVLMMKNYIHHGVTSCYQHCLNVSYYNYIICRALGLNARAGARAGLLHDLFLYDWHDCGKVKFKELHGFTHPRRALENANKNFLLTCCEKDIILCHMFPLTFTLPKYKETAVIILVDKYCGLIETLEGIAIRMRILRRTASNNTAI